MLNGRLQQALTCVAIAVVLAAMASFPVVARAEVVLDVYENGYEAKNPVADNITRVKINKLDKSDHEPIKGALLCIVNEETGEIVDKWESNGTTHEIARNVAGVGKGGALDVGTWYILKELSVPDGYSDNFKKLQDDPDTPHLIHFMINSDDFNTSGETDIDEEIAEFVDTEEIRGSGSEQAFVINLYNESVRYEEVVKERTRKRKDEDEAKDEDAKSEDTSSQNSKSDKSNSEAANGNGSSNDSSEATNADTKGEQSSEGSRSAASPSGSASSRQTSSSSQSSAQQQSQSRVTRQSQDGRSARMSSSGSDAGSNATPHTADRTSALAGIVLAGAGMVLFAVAKGLSGARGSD